MVERHQPRKARYGSLISSTSKTGRVLGYNPSTAGSGTESAKRYLTFTYQEDRTLLRNSSDLSTCTENFNEELNVSIHTGRILLSTHMLINV